MAGVTAHGAVFTYQPANGAAVSAIVAGLSVDTPSAEIVDMTGMHDGKGLQVLVPTGALASGASGSVTVDYLSPGSTGIDWQIMVGSVGQLTFTSNNYSVSRRVALENASSEARAGELVRGSLRFKMTDFY